jgi:hypothetical protein
VWRTPYQSEEKEMKRTIGLMGLMLVAVAAFAQPAAASERRDYDHRPVVVERARVDYNRRPVVVERGRVDYQRRPVVVRRDAYCR